MYTTHPERWVFYISAGIGCPKRRKSIQAGDHVTAFSKKISVQKNTRSTFAEVNLQAIGSNLEHIRRKVGKKVRIMAMVKANAYGHGSEAVAAYIEKKHADAFGVAFPEEGVVLRKAGIRKPIQVMVNLLTREQAKVCVDHKLEPTMCSVAEAIMLDALGKKMRRTIPVHLKIDTGMNRVGVKVHELESFLSGVRRTKRIELRSVFTHFATSDSRDKSFTREQLHLFSEALEILRKNGIEPECIHAANSAAILDFPESYFSMVRPGIAIYGYYPSEEVSKEMPLRPALSLKTSVSLVKKLGTGESVSYGRRYIVQHQTNIATLPLGYGDGFSRLLMGKARVLIQGRKFPVVGTICMDQLMVDVGDTDVSPGEEAVIIGSQGEETITALDLANEMGTIPYEICTAITSRVPRIYTKK
jgi:alanine racemase